MIKLIIGKSGAGKDTLAKQLIAEGYQPIVSYTTRPKREGEIDGVDYMFVSNDNFQYLIGSGTLLEYRTYDTCVGNKKDTWYYGTPVIKPQMPSVGVVTPKGAVSFIDFYGVDNIEIIFVDASDEIREERAKKRGSFDQAEWDRRLKADAKDFSPKVLKMLEKKLGKPYGYYNNDAERSQNET